MELFRVPVAAGVGEMTEREYQKIRLQGIAARQAGRPADANPYRNKPSLRRQADAWAAGHNEADRERRRK